MTSKELAALGMALVAIIAFIGLIVVGMDQADAAKTQQMKNCVDAGGDWVRDGFTAYYECKGVAR